MCIRDRCIALACDIRIGAASSFITTAYRNIGFSGDYGGTWMLNQLVGPAKDKELFFTGRRVQADEALARALATAPAAAKAATAAPAARSRWAATRASAARAGRWRWAATAD